MLEHILEAKARYLLGKQFHGIFNGSHIEPSSVAEFVGSWPQYRKGYIDLVPDQEKVERLDILAYAMVFLEGKFGKQPDYGLEQAIQDVAKEAAEQRQNLVFLQHLSYLGILYERTYGGSPSSLTI